MKKSPPAFPQREIKESYLINKFFCFFNNLLDSGHIKFAEEENIFISANLLTRIT